VLSGEHLLWEPAVTPVFTSDIEEAWPRTAGAR